MRPSIVSSHHSMDRQPRGARYETSTSEDQDQEAGLLPVIRFLQGALSMKAKVRLGCTRPVLGSSGPYRLVLQYTRAKKLRSVMPPCELAATLVTCCVASRLRGHSHGMNATHVDSLSCKLCCCPVYATCRSSRNAACSDDHAHHGFMFTHEVTVPYKDASVVRTSIMLLPLSSRGMTCTTDTWWRNYSPGTIPRRSGGCTSGSASVSP